MHKSFFLRRCTASRSVGLAILFLLSPLLLGAQQRDSTARRAKADSLRADSIRVADSLAIVRELEGKDKGKPAGTSPAGQAGASNPRLLPDLSAVGDLIGDLSPKGSTEEDRSRFGIREVEVAIQAAVDPYFRGDVFLGISDNEGVSIEQAYLTASALPWGLELRLGRLLMPVGKENTTHRHDLHTIEYPYVLQRFLGPEGLKGTGIYASKVVSPFGFYQELIVTAVDRFGEVNPDLVADEPANKKLTGLGYSARLRNYWDLSQSANVELSGSVITGEREQPLNNPLADGTNAVDVRQTVYGADLTVRWRPLQQGLYRSFILQTEVLRQVNGVPASDVGYAGPTRDYTGFYAYARWQTGRRGYVGARTDVLQDPDYGGGTTRAASAYLEFFPSEFSKLVAGYERVIPPRTSAAAYDRIILQATFALGPHKPHPF
ncbi:MAG: hypothetical protein IPK33_00585 [Gemmatimonadetes bacterium]|nr:hypothetical protein [Gemmatimonadota bacterium]